MTKLLVIFFALFAFSGCSKVWTADDVLDRFRLAGLEAESPSVMTKDDYGLAPVLAIEGVHFFVPSIGEGKGGRILVFDNNKSRDETVEFYESLGSQGTSLHSWVFVKDNIVIQINGELPEEQAMKYKAALEAE